ncbi:hypothetical protein ACHAXA_002851 [Cyclostephanos tholiformis]|uniref:beta-galactosidase n=1 Tax=Cyclostephanos tholiformis TaxID=382380 RepID=A0ABD3RBI4_9STRA
MLVRPIVRRRRRRSRPLSIRDRAVQLDARRSRVAAAGAAGGGGDEEPSGIVVDDVPRYTNVQMPFDTLYPHVPTRDNPTGVYRLTFSSLPHFWLAGEGCDDDDDGGGGCIYRDDEDDDGGRRRDSTIGGGRRRVVLHFGGIEGCYFAYMNGHFVGMGKDSRLPSEFDVTPYVNSRRPTRIPETRGGGWRGGMGGGGGGKDDGEDRPSTMMGGRVDDHIDDNDDDGCAGEVGGGSEETNLLVVVALKWSDSSFLEQQDHWRGMGGIHRSVYIYSTPAEAYIEDVFCIAEISSILTPHGRDDDDDEGDFGNSSSSVFPPMYTGRLSVQARIGRDNRTRVSGRNIYYNEQIKCTRSDGTEYRMIYQLYDYGWTPLFDAPIDPTIHHRGEGGNNVRIADAQLRSNLISFKVDVLGPVLAWSDECPTLYRFRATLIKIIVDNDADDDSPTSGRTSTSVIDVYDTLIGFRNVVVSDRKLLINGRAVLIKGVAISLDEILVDLRLMKRYNFNAIRTAHYPNDPYLYDMADKLGLYVIDEANIECHGHYDMICREHSFAFAMLDRVQRMVVRDQNHACIIGWSLGNEAGYSMHHKMLYGWIKGYDTSRFVQYEGYGEVGGCDCA